MSSVFQPVVRITYAENATFEEAYVTTYDLHNRAHTTPPKKLSTEQIPVLLFQLVERGYTVHKDAEWNGIELALIGIMTRSILAVSREWIDAAKQRAESAVSE